MNWTPMPFGKHKGKTLPQIVLSDPDYFFWLIDGDRIWPGRLRDEAEDINRKACAIIIPGMDTAKTQVMYGFWPKNGKLFEVTVVAVDRIPERRSYEVSSSDTLDMSVSRRVADYDKSGGKILVRAIKRLVFGNEGTRLTRSRCEAFFDDKANFDVAVEEVNTEPGGQPKGFF